MRWTVFIALVVAILSADVSSAETTEPAVAPEIDAATVPVFEGTVRRPHVVVGQIRDNLRKPFAFLPNPTKDKILAEIWERGKKMGADAVINARFGKTERTLFNHGRTPIS